MNKATSAYFRTPIFRRRGVNLAELVKECQKKGQRLPALFCFPQILKHRLRSINAAFKRARDTFSYKDDYILVYPIKVNQHSRVIESALLNKSDLE